MAFLRQGRNAYQPDWRRMIRERLSALEIGQEMKTPRPKNTSGKQFQINMDAAAKQTERAYPGVGFEIVEIDDGLVSVKRLR